LSYSGITVNKRQAAASWSIAREMRKKTVVCRSALLPVNKNKRRLHKRTPYFSFTTPLYKPKE
jgi:hypothetical protein